MEMMRLLWEEKGYGSLGLPAQNLRDKAAQGRNRQQDMGVSEDMNTNNETTMLWNNQLGNFQREIKKKILVFQRKFT